MLCPVCHTENFDDAMTCSSCSSSLNFLLQQTPAPQLPKSGFQDFDAPTLPPSQVARPTSVPASPRTGAAAALGLSASVATPDFGPRYRVEGKLGEGGMGSVYKARDVELDRPIALKVIRHELMANPEILQRFKQELLLASRISHKNVLRIHDLGEGVGVKFISMAYIEGRNLAEVLQEQKVLPLARAIEISKQICRALAAAHQEDVVHRDLKPQNILLDKEGCVYVSDFGLAKSLEADALAATAMTSAGQVLGTPRYMSPEQVECAPIDGRSDIYSFGLMLYEMVTGDLPFQGNSLQLMLGRVQSIPRNPTVLNAKLPPYVAGIIMRCLEKDPARRYQKFSEIVDDLENERFTPLGKSPARSQAGWTRRAVLGGIAILLVAGGLPLVRHYLPVIQGTRIQLGTSATSVPDKHLAVLPFKVEGDDPKLAELALGLNEALYAKFYGLNNVQMAPPSAVQKLGAASSLKKAARDLGANLLISGTIQGSGERVQIIVNLDDAAKDQRVFTHAFSGVRQDLLTLEDQIYAQLVVAVTSKPTNESLARVSQHQTENFAAYELYLKGRAAMRDQLNAESVKKAIDFYEQAVKVDPGFAMAYAGIADSDLRMYRSTKDRQWADHAVSAAQQAQSLNETLPEAYFALGSAYLATGKTAEAASTLKRAIDLAPNSDEGYRRLGDAFKSTGNEAEAFAAYKHAIQLNPYYWFNYNALGSAALKFNQNDEALKAFQKVIELEPDNASGYRNLSVAYFNLGKFEECIPVLQKSLELDKNPISYTNLGTVFFYLKRYAEAVPQFEEAVRLDPASVENLGNLADAYRWSGKTQQASATYDRAIEVALKSLAVNPRDYNRMGQIAEYYAKKGDNAHALAFVRRGRAIDPKDVTLMYVQAVVDQIAGRDQDALQNVEQALKNGYSLDDLQRDPELAKLESLPEFKNFLKTLPPSVK